jgi:hypothetical protein
LVNQWVFQVAEKSWVYICWPSTVSKILLLKYKIQLCIRNHILFSITLTAFILFSLVYLRSEPCPTLYSSHVSFRLQIGEPIGTRIFLQPSAETLRVKSNSKRLSISFLNARNRDFGEKLPTDSFSEWLSKYNHLLFCIFC